MPGIENPADITSIRTTPAQIANSSTRLAQNGPTCAKNLQVPDKLFDSVTLEERPLVSAVLQTLPSSEVFLLPSFELYSSDRLDTSLRYQ